MSDSIHKSTNKNPSRATQMYLRIAEIHDDTVVLKSGGLRAVLEVSSVNINLKSEDEQNSLAYSYQGFLNALEFPVQVVVRSKKLDISNYLEKIGDIGKKETRPLMKKQISEYGEYIHRLVEFADIMEKKFYVIIPFDPPRSMGKGMFQKFWEYIHPADSATAFKQRKNEFVHLTKSLGERIAQVKGGLESCGLTSRQVETKELISLFYEIYNPDTARLEKADQLEQTDISSHDHQPLPATT